MAVFDFTVRITRFGAADRARPLVRSISETFDRLGIDHLLVDLNRDGDMAWDGMYPTDPITISGSCSLTCGLDVQVTEAAEHLLPDAEVQVEWYAHEPANHHAARSDRRVERVARTFRGLARGAVPARVRLAILNPGAYLARYGIDGGGDVGLASSTLPSRALVDALCDVGATVGIDWLADRATVVDAVGDLLMRQELQFDDWEGRTASGLSSRWAATDELELATAEPFDQLAAETADHLNAVMFDAIRDALVLAPAAADGTGSDRIGDGETPDDGFVDSPEWLGELVLSAPAARAPYMPTWD